MSASHSLSVNGRLVSIDARGGILCGTFDTGEAFCGGRILSLPYDKLNARGTGSALQIQSSSGTTCILFESGDVWCAGPAFEPHFVDRHRGLAYQSIVVGENFGCGIDSERYVGFGLGDPGCTEGGICGVDAPLHDDRAGGGFVLGYPRMLQVTSARALASVGMFTCAIDADQRVTCWGTESEGLMLRSLREAKPELELEGEERTRGP